MNSTSNAPSSFAHFETEPTEEKSRINYVFARPLKQQIIQLKVQSSQSKERLKYEKPSNWKVRPLWENTIFLLGKLRKTIKNNASVDAWCNPQELYFLQN